MSTKELTTTKNRHYPACCDIYEDKGNVILTMEMPGVRKEDLDVRIDNDILIIQGKKTLHTTGTHLIREIKDGDYYNEYTLDNTIDRNKIEAALDKGVLTLTLSIKESEKPRKINVLTT